ncbi:unnamed protein product [Urochloa humidicola]
MSLSDPNTRPDEETIYVPNSFDLERDARDWEECTLVPWALHLPQGAGAQEIEDLPLDKPELQRRVLTSPFISWNHSSFGSSTTPTVIKRAGVEDSRGEASRSAYVISAASRARLAKGSSSGCASTSTTSLSTPGPPDIIERIIGMTCALQCINSDLVQPLDTRHIDLWAWTVNPSSIPKKVWLVFTHRPSERSTARVVVVIERWQLERWQQGVRYKVFLHVGLVEDYTAVAQDLHGAVNNPSTFTPIRSPYVWHYGVEDGGNASTARYPARLPLPPRERDAERHDATSHHDATRDGQDPRRCDCDERDGSAPRHSTGRRSCRDADFTWP